MSSGCRRASSRLINSMDAAARGAGLHGKTNGVRGAQAPQMWADGCHAEVLAYVAPDARTTWAHLSISART